MLGSPSLSPRKPIQRMAKAARWISRDKHGEESPMRSCQVCTTAGSMAVELSELSDFPRERALRAVQISHGNTPQFMSLSNYTEFGIAGGALGEFLTK